MSMVGQTISHYKILEKLGEGGMGVVYKAEDTTLERMVALKFLPPHLAASEADKARFIQEAKAASAINHPNICTIYAIDEHDGQMFIAMEFVDGQTLREKKDTISFKQAVEIGIQVSDGLAAAHEKGIVHRDIKPENIMIRKDGIAQIMDFGLAKLRSSSSKINRLTKEGSTVGTAGYMSPEQIQGQDADHRSDIFSLGVLLYELFTKELPFKGVHETALAYEIVNVDAAPMSAVVPEIEPTLDAIVLECLEKDPNERMQSVKQVGIDLKKYKRESSRQRVSRVTAARPVARVSSVRQNPPEEVAKRPMRRLVPWMVAGLCLLALAGVSWIHFREPKPVQLAITANILPPQGWRFYNEYDGGHIALSPDGSLLAFVVADSTGKSSLWVHSIESGIARMLEGTDGATYPFWSPDNRSIGFFADGSMKKILAAGGPTTVLAPAAGGRGGTWNAEGVILFSPTFDRTGLFKVTAAGGDVQEVTRVDSTRNETNHRWPLFLPDGKHFLYASQGGGSLGAYKGAIYVATLDAPEGKLLVKVASNMVYVGGRLLFVNQGVIVAQAFDPGSLSLTGDPTPVSGNLEFSADKIRGVFTCSGNGVLLYQPGHATNLQRTLTWSDRNGRFHLLAEPIKTTYSAQLSPDGGSIVYDTYDNLSKTSDVWIYDIVRGLKTRMTFEKSEENFALWSPNGKELVYSSDRNHFLNLFLRNSDGTATDKLLLPSSDDNIATDWSRDGSYLMFERVKPNAGFALEYLPMNGDRKPIPFLRENYSVAGAVFSPDARWVAYESDESGNRTDLFVRPFPSGTGKWQISTNGGRFPRWRRDGHELYYRSSDGSFIAVEVNGTDSTFVVGKSTPLFTIPRSADPQLYDVTPDGLKFLIGVIPGDGPPPILKLVTHWESEVR